jgi:hypothetical protein
MLVARSVLHIQAGLSGLRETNVDHAVELANRYANFGVISAFCGGGAMLMFVVSVGLDVMGLALIAGLCWLLMAWPLTIRQFYGDRQFADLLAGDQAPIHRRAPDAGLTGLGWLLICHAALTASFLLPQLIGDSASMTRQQEMLLALGGSVGVHSLWFNVGVLVLQGWAGFELVRMSPHSRVIAIAYGIVAAVTNLYILWPVLQVLKHAHGLDYDAALRIGPMALHLVLPVATFVLVTRKIAPTARARFRSARPTT